MNVRMIVKEREKGESANDIFEKLLKDATPPISIFAKKQCLSFTFSEEPIVLIRSCFLSCDRENVQFIVSKKKKKFFRFREFFSALSALQLTSGKKFLL